MSTHDDEPEVRLRSGQYVMRATLETIQALLAQGHMISVTGDGAVVAEPAVHDDAIAALATHPGDVAAVLDHLLEEMAHAR